MIHTRFWFVHTIYCLFICMRAVFYVYRWMCVSATFFMFYKHSLSVSAMAHHIYRHFAEKHTQNVNAHKERKKLKERKKVAHAKIYSHWYRLSLCHDNLHVKLSKCKKLTSSMEAKTLPDPKWFMNQKR